MGFFRLEVPVYPGRRSSTSFDWSKVETMATITQFDRSFSLTLGIEKIWFEVLHYLLLQTLTMLTNARPTLKDVSERFWTGLSCELEENSKQTMSMRSNEQNINKLEILKPNH